VTERLIALPPAMQREALPIRSFLERGHSFDDEAIRVMGLAYEFARSELRIIGKNELKEKIATRIIELAATGERDPDKLCDFAIKGLRKRKNSPRAVRPGTNGPVAGKPTAQGRLGIKMGSQSDTAWKTAARMAALAEEADNDAEREYYIRLRNAWITFANRCEFMPISNVTEG
jgi:hypothetical protein